MATHDPNSRLTGGPLGSPASASPNGVTEQRGNAGGTTGSTMPGATASQPEVRRPADETPAEKIGRFFRRAVERLSGHEEDEWRRGNDRNQRDRDTQDRYTQDRYRTGDRSWQSGRSALRDRRQSEWSDLGRSGDDRSASDQGGSAADRGGSYERPGGLGGRGEYQRDDTRLGAGVRSPYGQGSSGQGRYEGGESRSGQRPSFENRSGESLGQRGLGRSPGESYGLGEVPSDRPVGSDRGLVGERDDWNRREWSRSDPYRDRGEAPRGARMSTTGTSIGDASSGGSFGFARDEGRMDDWGETARDRDQGQGRRFWQREPLAARDVMTRNPRTVSRQSAHREAAAIMRDENCGVVPVVDAAGRLEGILTDRDIVVRGVAHDRAHELRIEDVMTDDVSAVTEDEPLTSVLDLMGRKQVRRVPVVDRDDRLLGIISMADIANRADYDEDLQDAFERISSRRSFWSLFS
jgi:CBS domain-containing protein